MSYSEQLEQDAERTRSHIEDTLDELRARLTPGQIVDQLLDRARDGNAAAFFRNLGRQAKDNPMPVAVVGAGLAWLAVASAFGGRSAAHNGHGQGVLAEDMEQQAGQAKAKLGAVADLAGSRMADAYDNTSAGVAGGVKRAAAAIGNSASNIGDTATRTSRGVVDFCKEQPLVAAGIGLAIGAVLGAALPSTGTEDRLLGETSDRVKQGAADTAQEMAGDNASSGSEAAVDTAERPGRTATDNTDGDSLSGLDGRGLPG